MTLLLAGAILLTALAAIAVGKRWRPAIARVLAGVRLLSDKVAILDAWILANGEMSRPEALRRILKLAAMRMPA